jgi:acyl-CoA thioesterase
VKGQDNFRELLGIKTVEVRENYAKMSMKVTKAHMNFYGATHGGVVFSLADCAFAEAVNCGGAIAVAVQASINFLKPSVEGDTLTAEAVKVSEGRTFGLYNITVRKEDKVVAVFSGLAYKQKQQMG